MNEGSDDPKIPRNRVAEVEYFGRNGTRVYLAAAWARANCKYEHRRACGLNVQMLSGPSGKGER